MFVEQMSRSRLPTEELMLQDLAHRLQNMCVGRRAIHIHLSELSPAYNNENYIRIATKSFAESVSGFEGHLFILEDQDLVFVSKDVTLTLLKQGVERLEALFLHDPLVEQTSPEGQTAFATFYDLEKDYNDFLFLAEDKCQKAKKRREEKESIAIVYKPKSKILTPSALTKLETALETVDVSNIARRQSICTLIDDNAPQFLFEEVFISLQDLESVLTPDIDIVSNLWLFRYLTRILDARLIRMLIRDG
jgi:hypothetical protein